MHGQLSARRQPQPPRRTDLALSEDGPAGASSEKPILQQVHRLSVTRIFLTLKSMGTPTGKQLTAPMTTSPTTLVLAGTGKTGSRVARRLVSAGHTVRAAARRGTDIRFDWDDPATYDNALAGADRVYLVPPANSVDFAAQVSRFLDVATGTAVEHVTYLSARGIEMAPPEVALRAVELDLESRDGFTHSVLRPAWFMQNFTESFLQPGILTARQVVAPAGGGAEAFVDTEDIADVAAATLTDPARHAGQGYTLTGPEALSFAEAAQTIGAVLGEPVSYVDIDTQQWTDATIAAGVPADYAGLLAGLFSVIQSGAGKSTSADVERVLGRAPGSFREFADRSRTAWTR